MSVVVWYNKETRAVMGTGDIHIIEENGKRIVDSVDWNEQTQDFVEKYDQPIEEPGPWWYWEDGLVHQSPPEAP